MDNISALILSGFVLRGRERKEPLLPQVRVLWLNIVPNPEGTLNRQSSALSSDRKQREIVLSASSMVRASVLMDSFRISSSNLQSIANKPEALTRFNLSSNLRRTKYTRQIASTRRVLGNAKIYHSCCFSYVGRSGAARLRRGTLKMSYRLTITSWVQSPPAAQIRKTVYFLKKKRQSLHNFETIKIDRDVSKGGIL